VYNHLGFHKISDDSGVDSEWKLLLVRAGNVQWSIYCNFNLPFQQIVRKYSKKFFKEIIEVKTSTGKKIRVSEGI